MNTIALIDADEAAIKAVFTAQKGAVDWLEDGDAPPQPSVACAISAAVVIVEAWAAAVGADEIRLCFSPVDRSNFRTEVEPTYKQTREKEKPDVYWEVCLELKRRYQFSWEPRLEGDDILGLLTKDTKTERTVICSSDKDMKTVPGRLYSPFHNAKFRIKEQDANRWWMMQTLTGDPSDGYKGLPGCGKVRAEKILAANYTLPFMWDCVVGAYLDKGFTEQDALTQARLARILRPGDYDFDTQEIRLWTPGC